jgi:hypothetical protein
MFHFTRNETYIVAWVNQKKKSNQTHKREVSRKQKPTMMSRTTHSIAQKGLVFIEETKLDY